jgi:isonocardicin synthase
MINHTVNFSETINPGVSKKKFEKEKILLKKFIISEHCVAQKLDLNVLNNRKSEYMRIKFSELPQSLFFFTIKKQKFIGRKLLSKLCLYKNLPGLFCSQIKDYMIMGIFEREQIYEDGIIVFFRPLENSEKISVFNELAENRSIDIYHPYVPLFDDKKLEKVGPDDGWDVTKEWADFLDTGEELIREETLKFLLKFNLHGKTIYDPACSTGKFLKTIKEQYSSVYTIGQDLSPKMVEYAKDCIDEVYCGDSINPMVEDNSVDFIFFRFLNAEVVTTRQAYQLFINIAEKCKIGGYIILLGHTSILISKPWLEALGLNILQCNAYSEKENSIFQYYVMKKEKNLKDITNPLNFDSYS